MKTLQDLIKVAATAGLTVELSMLANVKSGQMVATVRNPGSIKIIDNLIVNPDYTISGDTFDALVRKLESLCILPTNAAKAAEAEPAKWFKFVGLPITHWGSGTEEQARAYAEIKARRYPGARYVEVDGEPTDEGATVINLDAMLSVARQADG